ILYNKLKELDPIVSKVEQLDKPSIAWFSPLPPIESGISDYSLDIINELSKTVHVDIYIDNYKPIDIKNGHCHVYHHDQYPKHHAKYEKTIYHIGNNMFHAYMMPYLMKYNGIIVLHDLNLSGLALNLYYAKNKVDEFIRALSEDHDIEKVKAYVDGLVKGTNGLKETEFSCHKFVTKHAEKVIVHSEYAKQYLLKKDLGMNVTHIPLYGILKSNPSRETAKKELKIDQDIFVITVVGYAQHAKRILPIVNAFIKLNHENPRTKLVIVGKTTADIKKSVDEILLQNKKEHMVEITGYVESDILDQYIVASELCMNLRYPYYGESSASLMRILGIGRTTIVTDIGSFGELPNEVVYKLDPPNLNGDLAEEKTILSAMKLLLFDEKKRIKYEENSQKFVEHHSISDTAQLYEQAIYTQSKIIDNYASLIEKITHAIIGRDITDRSMLYGLAQTLAYAKVGNHNHNIKDLEDAVEEISAFEIMQDIKSTIAKGKL
ncbi:MAG: glycosyltransferase, partial [Sphingobacteriia bacterium]|nr:glycosyltransferase [Sphingobacteriia bacterium]